MNCEYAIKFVATLVKSKTGKTLTPLQKDILKASLLNQKYSTLTEKLYLSEGAVKDAAYRLWKLLSAIFGEKVTKTSFKSIVQSQEFFSANIIQENRATVKQQPTQATILVVDDLLENLQLLSVLLRKKGYTVHTVTNGITALNLVHTNPPDLVLLDIKMPDMDGYQVCEALKLNEITCEIPVIFLTVSDEVSDKEKAFHSGGVDYITKPFDATEVILRIENQLAIKQQKYLLQQKIIQGQQSQEALHQSRSLLANVLNSCQEKIAAMQAIREPTTGEIMDFQCLVVNRVMAQFLNCKKEYWSGKFSFKKFIDQHDPSLFDDFVQVVETGEPMECN
ncbi:MAG: response regulator, partial [Coleofasciculus sp. C2-GNP5-27]